ncbi:MAG TPA: DivIVA domain-containing protein [Clostridiales bacterium]|nr:DivIVA domain-containing protein [Clostridiales bacterium]
MMTPQDIREKAFEKAVFGGYDMAAVDDFLEEVSNDYASIYKENTVLKSKIKVLVEKVEEYRSSEEAMRLTLLSAQKLGVQIETEAREKSEGILAAAKKEAERITKQAKLEVATEKARLVEAKKSSAQFIENLRQLCAKQLDFIDSLSEFELSEQELASFGVQKGGQEPDLELADTVRSIEDSVAKAASEPDSDIEIHAEEGGAADDNGQPTRLYNFGKDMGGEAPTAKFSLDNLRFGGNYSK